MQKQCENCKETFSTKDSRRKTCGKTCGDVNRRLWKRTTERPLVTSTRPGSLPAPEELPAPYAKRVHDMWAALVGDGTVPTRIA